MEKVHKITNGRIHGNVHAADITRRLAVLVCLFCFALVFGACGRETDAFSFTEEEPLLAGPQDAVMDVVNADGQSAAEDSALQAAAGHTEASGAPQPQPLQEQDSAGAPGTPQNHAAAGHTEASDAPQSQPLQEPAVARFVVHICGAVKQPGVYELPEGSRVMDAVTAGGGFTADADQAACNLAEQVRDGCRIYIVTKKESAQMQTAVLQAGIQPDRAAAAGSTGAGTAEKSPAAAQGGGTAGNAAGGTAGNAAGNAAGSTAGNVGASADGFADGRVNLNTADTAALLTLPGIGESRARAIIDWRSQHGSFQRIEDIMKVSGIKQASFDKLKDYITVK